MNENQSHTDDHYHFIDQTLHRFDAAEGLVQPGHALRERVYLTNDAPGPLPFAAHDALPWMRKHIRTALDAVTAARTLGVHHMGWQIADATFPALRTYCLYSISDLIHDWGAECARACNDTDAEARMLTSGGLMRLDPGQHHKALENFERAAELFHRSDNQLGAARTLNYKGLAHIGLGDTKRARTFFAAAVKQCTQVGDARTAALARLNLAEIHLGHQRYDLARQDATAADDVLTQHRDELNSARAQIVTARAHTGLGNLDQADQCLAVAVTVLARLGSSIDRASLHRTRADIAQRRAQQHTKRDANELDAALLRQMAFEIYAALNVPSPRWTSIYPK